MRLADAITAAIDRFYVRPVAVLLPLETFRYAACGGMTYVLFDPTCYFLIYNYIVGTGFSVDFLRRLLAQPQRGVSPVALAYEDSAMAVCPFDRRLALADLCGAEVLR